MARAWIALASLCAAGCGDELPGPQGGAGSPQIRSFTVTPEEVAPYGTAQLAWEVIGAKSISVLQGQRTLISTFEPSGAIASESMERTTVFTLQARGGDETQTAERTVRVPWPQATITSFTFGGPEVIGAQGLLSWTADASTEGALWVDGRLRHRLDRAGVARHIGPQLVESSTCTFRLEVRNPESSDEETIHLEALPLPVIDVFDVSPRTYFGTSTTATVRWAVREADQVKLNTLEGSVIVPPSGTMQRRVEGMATLALDAERRSIVVSATGFVAPAMSEGEENDPPSGHEMTTAGGVEGLLQSAVDVDRYWIDIYVGRHALIETGADGTCPTDTTLLAFDANNNSLGGAEGGGPATGRGGECAVLRVALAPGSPRIYIDVASEHGETGRYRMVVRGEP